MIRLRILMLVVQAVWRGGPGGGGGGRDLSGQPGGGREEGEVALWAEGLSAGQG